LVSFEREREKGKRERESLCGSFLYRLYGISLKGFVLFSCEEMNCVFEKMFRWKMRGRNVFLYVYIWMK